eukprot:4079677-Amphidinium_carterae.2
MDVPMDIEFDEHPDHRSSKFMSFSDLPDSSVTMCSKHHLFHEILEFALARAFAEPCMHGVQWGQVVDVLLLQGGSGRRSYMRGDEASAWANRSFVLEKVGGKS